MNFDLSFDSIAGGLDSEHQPDIHRRRAVRQQTPGDLQNHVRQQHESRLALNIFLSLK